MEEVASIIRELAEQMGLTVEYLWPYLIKQAIVDWIGGLLVLFLFIFTGAIIYKIGKGLEGEDQEILYWAATLMGVVAFVVLFILLLNIDMILVPEADVVDSLLRKVR